MKSILFCLVTCSLTAILLTSCYTRLAFSRVSGDVSESPSEAGFVQSPPPVQQPLVVIRPQPIIGLPPSHKPTQEKPSTDSSTDNPGKKESKRVSVYSSKRPHKSKIVHSKPSSPKRYGSRRRR